MDMLRPKRDIAQFMKWAEEAEKFAHIMYWATKK